MQFHRLSRPTGISITPLFFLLCAAKWMDTLERGKKKKNTLEQCPSASTTTHDVEERRAFTIYSASFVYCFRRVDRDKAIGGNFSAGNRKRNSICVWSVDLIERSRETILNETLIQQRRGDERATRDWFIVIRASYAATTTSAAYQKTMNSGLCGRVRLEFDIDQKRCRRV